MLISGTFNSLEDYHIPSDPQIYEEYRTFNSLEDYPKERHARPTHQQQGLFQFPRGLSGRLSKVAVYKFLSGPFNSLEDYLRILKAEKEKNVQKLSIP